MFHLIFIPQFWCPLDVLAFEHLEKKEILDLICYSLTIQRRSDRVCGRRDSLVPCGIHSGWMICKVNGAEYRAEITLGKDEHN